MATLAELMNEMFNKAKQDPYVVNAGQIVDNKLNTGNSGLASSLTATAPAYTGVGTTGSSLSVDLQKSLRAAGVNAQAQTNFAAGPTVGNADLLKDSTASFTPTISGDYKGHPFGDSITLENGKAMNDGGLFGAERAATATDFNNYNDSVAAGVVDPAKMDQKTWAKLKNDSDANSSANWSTGVTAALGVGQLGLGVASYLDQKDMLKANKKLLNQQYNINADKFAKSKQYDIDRKAAWTVK